MTTLLRPQFSDELDRIASAVTALGWSGTIRGPVYFGGVTFYAVTCPPAHFGPPGSSWLAGCLVSCTDPREGMQDASLLAAYSRRAILVRAPLDAIDMVDLQLHGALLDQGVVVQAGGHSTVVSWAGEVVASLLHHDEAWRHDARWRQFYGTVTGRSAV